MAEPTKLSQDAFERLQAEHAQLTGEGRIRIANAIEAARALGDLKENGDYHAAKDEQGKMESRIRQIEAMLENLEIVEVEHSDTVEQGHVVGITYEGDDEIEYYLLGSIEERREGITVMSPSSPLGSALIGRKLGDTVTYEAPSGALKVTIADIKA